MSQDPQASEPNLEECFAVAFEAAIAAGRIIRNKIKDTSAKQNLSQTKLNHTDIVTQIDKECEKVIINLLEIKYPDYEIIAEESADGKEKQTNEIAMKVPVWCIDPIDGTTNFYHGLPFVAVCIGLRYKNVSLLGIVLNPILNEMFYAMKGSGAYVLDTSALISNNKDPFIFSKNILKSSEAIGVNTLQFINGNEEASVIEKLSNSKDIETSIGLQKALILTEVGYARDNDWVTAVLKRLDILLLEEKVRGIRMLGSCALNMCYVASGRAHIFFEGKNSTFGPKPWDFTAAEVIVLEAGGCLYLPETIGDYPKPIEFDCTKGRILCCNNISAVQAILDLKLYMPSEAHEYGNDAIEQKE